MAVASGSSDLWKLAYRQPMRLALVMAACTPSFHGVPCPGRTIRDLNFGKAAE